MRERLRNWIKKHSSIYCILKFTRQFMNYDFRDYLLSYRIGSRWREFSLPPSSEPNAMNLTIHQRGELNPDKVIFEIPLDTAGFGLCSQLIVLLNRINFADKLGMTPCINWYASYLYKEEQAVRGTTNIFEYYFEPIRGISVAEAEKSRFVIYDNLNTGYGTDWSYFPIVGKEYNYTEEQLSEFAFLVQKYFRLQKPVRRKLQKQIKNILGGRKVLGVHGRGGDMKLAFLDHPLCVSGNQYADAAEEAMEQIGADLVFLATDDLEILKTFQYRFGNRLIYYKDVIRSPGSIHNAMITVDRPLHHYKLGYEILRDVYTLANCQGLLTGLSTVNGMARILNKALGKEYEYQQILDNGRHKCGVNVNSPNFLKDDAKIVEKIRKIQMQEELDENRKMQLIEDLLAKIYHIPELSAEGK